MRAAPFSLTFLAFAFIALVSTSFAAQCVENLYKSVIASEMGGLIAVSLAVALSMIVLAYMLGIATSNVRLTIFAKDESHHLFFSALLVIGVNVIFFVSCQAFGSFLDFALSSDVLDAGGTCYTGIESPQEAALCYVSNMKGTADGMVRQLLREHIGNEMASTFAVAVYNPVTGGATLPLSAEKKTYSMQFEMVLMSFTMPALISLTIQKIFLDFMIDIIKWVIPIAFFFRILPFTRSGGNLLLAFALAIYIIVPVFYALNGAMDGAMNRDANNDRISDVCVSYSALIDDAVMGTCRSQVSFWNVARLLPQAFFLPNLTLALTITFLSGINKALRVLT